MKRIELLQLPRASSPAPNSSAEGEKEKGGKENCPLCGFSFSVAEAACQGCAILGGCSMLKCPNCHYEFVTESKIYHWFQKIFRKGKRHGRDR